MKLTLLEYFDIVIREGHKKSVYDCPSLVDTELSAMVRGFSDVTRRLGDVTFYTIEMGPKRKPRKGDEDARKRQQIERRRELQMARLERETKYGAITLARQEKNWERMLTEAALPRMRDDLTYAWRCFERAVDCKDFAIGLLMDELDEAERHRFLNATAHSEHIDRIIDGFGARVRELDREFAEEIKRVMDERVATLSDARSSSRENEDHLKTALHILEMATKEVRRTRRADYFSKLEEQASKDAQLVEQCAAVLEEIRLSARDATVAFVDRYRDRTRERKNADDKLKKRDDRLQATIAKRLDAIRAASDRARALRVARAEQRAYFERKLADLRGERDFFLAAFDALKRKLARDRAADFERAARLAACHDDVATRLGDVRARAERVLRLGATCRRLETLEEKVLPFPANFGREMSRPAYVTAEYATALDVFWQRVGNAEASRRALAEQRRSIAAENEALRGEIFRRYCRCVTCPGMAATEEHREEGTNVTDAAFEIKKYRKQSGGSINKC